MERLLPDGVQNCPVCLGKRFVTPDVEPTHPQFSTIIPCPVCGKNMQQDYLERLCGLTAEMRSWTFDTTQTLVIETNAEAISAARAIADDPRWTLTFTGEYGTGKTRMLACIVNAGRRAGWPSVYITTAALLDHLRSAYAPGAPVAFDQLWERISKAKILAIDELDRWNPTGWAQEKFFELIDSRYRHGDEVATVMATNAPIEALPGYLASRLCDGRSLVVDMGGFDWRPHVGKK